ncbi:MAG: hypothetical protein ACFFCH_01225 [Promethearchaeota archaeon]
MMGLAAKSSMKDNFFDDLSTPLQLETFFLQLATAFAKLAYTRLTKKQRFLLLMTNQTLQYHPKLSPTALADCLARKFHLPLSTTKFNLNVLTRAGLLQPRRSKDQGSRICLSFGGWLLTQLLSESDIE